MNNPTNQYLVRQGDVGIVAVAALPKTAKADTPRQDDKVILAWGEVTGHHHRIESASGRCELLTDPATNERFLRIMDASGVDLVHEEHAAITLPPGIYRVIQQREYVAPEIERAVAD